MPERIQLRRTKGWRKQENVIVVARPTRYGNPFRIAGGNVYGLDWSTARERFGRGTAFYLRDNWLISVYTTHAPAHVAVEAAVDLFRALCRVEQRDNPEEFAAWIEPLRGKNLACWCPLDQPCHADVLLELANPGEGSHR